MERSVYVPKFCQYLKELLSKLEDRFPEEQDFGLLHTALILALGAGQQEVVVKEYHMYVFKYREAIDKEDEDFLLKNDYNSVITDLKADAQEGKLKVEHFRKMFLSERVTNKDKQIAWKYLKILNKLMDGIIQKGEVVIT